MCCRFPREVVCIQTDNGFSSLSLYNMFDNPISFLRFPVFLSGT